MNVNKNWKSSFKAFLYLLPALIILLVFNIYPIIRSFSLSVSLDYNFLSGQSSGLGLDNFIELFNDADFYLALKNTAVYVGFVSFFSIAIGLGIALLLNKIDALKNFFQTVYFLPFVTSTVAVSLVWSWLFHGNYGLFNYFLGMFGVDSINWLTNPDTALFALIIMSVWKGLGFNVLILLAGLNNIDKVYYQVAEMDGASKFQQFSKITVPLLSPTLLYVSIMAIINNFKVFDEVYSLFNGQPGPGKSTLTVVFYIYEKFYEEFNYGLASAAGIVLFIIILVFTLLQFALSKKYVHYQ